MEKHGKLGFWILISGLLVAGAIVFHALSRPTPRADIGRYRFQPSSPPGTIWVIDTVTGVVKAK